MLAATATFGLRVTHCIEDPNRPIVYAADTGNSAVDVIDLGTLSVVGMIPVGQSPEGMALSPDGSKLYVANAGSDSISVISTQAQSLYTTFQLPSHSAPTDVQFGTNNRLWVLTSTDIEQVDANSGIPTGPSLRSARVLDQVAGGDIKVSPDGTWLYYCQNNISPASLYKFDVSQSTPVASWATSMSSGSSDMELNHSGTTMVPVTTTSASALSEDRTSDDSVVGTLNIGSTPSAFTYSPNDQVGYAAAGPAIGIYNLQTFAKTASIAATGTPVELFVDNAARYLFAAEAQRMEIFTINGTPSPSARLVFSHQPTATAAGSAVAPSIVVEDVDVNGQVVAGDNGSVMLSIASGPVGATLGGTATVMAVNGVATFNNVILSAAGTYTLTASNGATSSATSAPFVVGRTGEFATTLTLASSNSMPVTGGTAIYTATIHTSGGGAATPTGAVQFYDNGVLLGAKPVQAGGTATFVASNLTAGAHTITATYLGDSTFTASNASPLLETVGAVLVTGEHSSLIANVATNGVAPWGLVPGDAGRLNVTIRNQGSGLAAGVVGIQLVATTDGNPADGIPLPGRPSSVYVHLMGGDSRTISVSFTVPASLPAGAYSIMAVLAPASSGITSAMIDASAQARTSAPATVALSFGNVGGHAGMTLTRAEPDGTVVTYRLTGQGTGTLSDDGVTDPTLTLTGTTAGTVVTITTRGGSSTLTLAGIASNGPIGAINAPTTTLAGVGAVQGAVGRLVLGSLSNSNLAAVSFGAVVIDGSVDSSKLLAGTNFGPDGQPGGGDDTYAAGRIGSIRVLGDVTASVLAAGLNPTDGVYLNGNDALISGSQIGPIQIAGTVSPDSRILAAALPRVALIAHAAVPTATDPRFAM
jgi:YVTN family beta-propeller protein